MFAYIPCLAYLSYHPRLGCLCPRSPGQYVGNHHSGRAVFHWNDYIFDPNVLRGVLKPWVLSWNTYWILVGNCYHDNRWLWEFCPTTSYGYAVGAACAITGMFAACLPIPIISENFSKMRQGQRLLDDFQHSSRTTLHHLDKRRGVRICHVCYTRSFMDTKLGTISGEQIMSMS